MSRLSLIAVLVMAGCAPSKPDLRPFVAAAMKYSSMAISSPAPAPSPSPGPQQCRNCRGTGVVGDGVVQTVCPVCKGKKVTECKDGTCPTPSIISR